MSNNKNQNLSIKILLAVLAAGIIIGLIAGLVAGYYWGRQNQPDSAIIQTNANINTVATAQDLSPAEIYYQSGAITKIQGQDIYFKGPVINTTQPNQEAEYKAATTANTQFISLNTVTDEEKTISLGDLSIDDSISAVASENVKNKTEYTAIKIILIKN